MGMARSLFFSESLAGSGASGTRGDGFQPHCSVKSIILRYLFLRFSKRSHSKLVKAKPVNGCGALDPHSKGSPTTPADGQHRTASTGCATNPPTPAASENSTTDWHGR